MLVLDLAFFFARMLGHIRDTNLQNELLMTSVQSLDDGNSISSEY
jgi:hypothetical protein